MIRTISSVRKLFLAAVVSAAALFPSAALAGDRDHRDRRDRYDRGDRYEHRDYRRYDHRDRDDVRVDVRFGTVPPPVCTERVWVEPVYRTVCERVWVEPVYRTECERIWIEPVYEVRQVVRWEHGRRVVCHERVMVRPGRWEEHPRQVLVREGHWQTIERQELVRAGYWEDRVVQPPVYAGSGWSIDFGWRR